MPIYEFYCRNCHMLFSFLSRSINTEKRPRCPRCRETRLDRQVSAFAVTGRATEGGEDGEPAFDEAKMTGALDALAGEAESLDEDDPRQAARLMRKFSNLTGIEFNEGMETALNRMEAGEDPEKIESEMGDLLDGEEEPFVIRSGGKARTGRRTDPPQRDPKLYEM